MLKKIHESWLQYVVQKQLPYGVVGQLLNTWLLNVKVRSSSPHTCNLGYLGALIK
jgi:hypothetical protein